MISAWWLLLIIPITFVVGIGYGAVLSEGKQADKCAKCMYNSIEKEKSK
jgi:hypothetical protein